MPRTTQRIVILLASVVALTVLGTSLAFSAGAPIPDSNGVYSACYDSGGNVKFVVSGASCPKGWAGPAPGTRKDRVGCRARRVTRG